MTRAGPGHSLRTVNRLTLKLIQAIVAPVFLMGSLFCVCLPTPDAHAYGADTQAADTDAEGSCCDHAQHGTDPMPDHRPDCPHCGHSQLVKPDGVDASASLIPILVLSLPPDPAAEFNPLPRTSSLKPRVENLILGHPPSPILHQKCVLII